MTTDFTAQRLAMVKEHLRPRGIDDPRVLAAMAEVPREWFVPSTIVPTAYEDCAQPIDCGQTISQPFTVAYMCQLAQLTGNERVLEVGTGSGYGAAVLSRIAREVYTVERIPELAVAAAKIYPQLGYDNVHVRHNDGTRGLAEGAPYDCIMVTAGAEALPLDYLDQAADGCRIIIPIGATQNSQNMYRFVKQNRELFIENLGRFAFVPLIGEHSWRDEEGRKTPK